MRYALLTRLSAAVLAVTISAPLLAQSKDCCGDNPPIRSIDRTCLPAGPSKYNLPYYLTDVGGKYAEIATIDSFSATDECDDTKVRQLDDLKRKGMATGADAIIRVRLLANRITGWQENPHTPFFSLRQGSSRDTFMRATAIKWLEQPPTQPTLKKAQTAKALAPGASTRSGMLNLDSFMKNRARRNDPFDDRQNMTVPEVYTQQPSGRF